MTAAIAPPASAGRAVWLPSVEAAAANPAAAVLELLDAVPSARSAAGLLAVDPAEVPDEQLPDLLACLRRLESLVAARTTEALARMTVDFDDLDAGHALRLGRGSAAATISRASWLTETVPAAHAALAAGALTAFQAKIVYDVLVGTEPAVARGVVARVMPLGDCPPAKWRALLTKALIELDPDAQASAHDDERLKRGTWVKPVQHGMGVFGAYLTAEECSLAQEALYARSKADRVADDARTLDQQHADALVAILTDYLHTPQSGTTQGMRPGVNITIAWSTLFGADNLPAELDRYGAITAPQARRIAAQAGARWRLLVTDDDLNLIARTRAAYEPSPEQRAFVIARDRHCTFPGCQVPAMLCDLDHINEWPLGPTAVWNLHPLCRYHHRAKTLGIIDCQRDADTGQTTWYLTRGRQTTNKPPDLPAAQPPPEPEQLDTEIDPGLPEAQKAPEPPDDPPF